jgi:hypothetical protein
MTAKTEDLRAFFGKRAGTLHDAGLSRAEAVVQVVRQRGVVLGWCFCAWCASRRVPAVVTSPPIALDRIDMGAQLSLGDRGELLGIGRIATW